VESSIKNTKSRKERYRVKWSVIFNRLIKEVSLSNCHLFSLKAMTEVRLDTLEKNVPVRRK
jgi:hypothetical protein